MALYRANDKGLVLKTTEFTGFLKELKYAVGNRTTMRRVITYEVGRVLERSLALTGAADTGKIRERVKNRSMFMVDGKRYFLSYKGKAQRVPDAIWARIPDMRKRSLTRKLAAAGITKKSWLHLADMIGEQIKAPAYVRQAKVSNPGEPGNVRIAWKEEGDACVLMIENNCPMLGYPGTEGTQAFFAALAGRIKFFQQNMARGVYLDAEKAAKKHKGIFIGQR